MGWAHHLPSRLLSKLNTIIDTCVSCSVPITSLAAFLFALKTASSTRSRQHLSLLTAGVRDTYLEAKRYYCLFKASSSAWISANNFLWSEACFTRRFLIRLNEFT